MIGITGIISAILGVVAGAIPKAFDYADKKLTFAQEMAIRKFEAEAREKEQKFALEAKALEASAKMHESYYEAVAQVDENARAHAEELFSQLVKPTGYAFLDIVNAAIRPMFTMTLTVLFVVALVSWMYGVGSINDEFGKQLGGLFAVCMEGIIFFVYGSRQVQKPGTFNIFGK